MAFKDEADAIQQWQNVRGTCHAFAQSDLLKGRDTNVPVGRRRVQVAGGICQALCMYFVKCRMESMGDAQIARLLVSKFDDIMKTQAGIQHGTVSGSTILGEKADKSGAAGVVRAAASRAELLDIVLTKRGLYGYGVYEGRLVLGQGHAFAFDTTDTMVTGEKSDGLYFLDPNVGLFVGAVTDAQFRTWYREFWKTPMFEGRSYKSIFNHGARELRAWGASGHRWQRPPGHL